MKDDRMVRLIISDPDNNVLKTESLEEMHRTLFKNYMKFANEWERRQKFGDPNMYGHREKKSFENALISLDSINMYANEAIAYLLTGNFEKVYTWLREVRDISEPYAKE